MIQFRSVFSEKTIYKNTYLSKIFFLNCLRGSDTCADMTIVGKKKKKHPESVKKSATN